jgi:inner membrane protein involved in colicin E2 resistance
MREKIDFYCSLLFSALFGLLFFDVILEAFGVMHRLPQAHKEIFLMGFLIWFVSVMGRRDRDDDWAGQV